MPNINDYLEWRCDISFAHDPFNDVDNLILAELSYAHFDAPGFRREVTESEQYKAVIEKVKSIVPESSVIGLLLSSEAAHKYMVASSVKGMQQHDGMTWQVKRNGFVHAEQSDFGRFIKDTQMDWLSRIDDGSRAKFVNALFSLLEATGADTFSEMKGQKLKSIEQILNTVRDMSDETQKLLLDITGELLGSGSRTIRQVLADLKQEREKIKNRAEGKEE